MLEICYLSISFALGERYGQWSFDSEIIRTGIRLVPIFCYGYVYRRFVCAGQTAKPQAKLTPPFSAAVLLLLLFAACYTNAGNEVLRWQVVFALSGLVAGLREELFYRGLVQHYFRTKYNDRLALVLASLTFTLSHVQYIVHGQWHGLLLIALAGVIFGSVFIFTRSIVLTSVVHGLYDAILSVDISPTRLSHATALAVLSLLTLLFLRLIAKDLKPKASPWFWRRPFGSLGFEKALSKSASDTYFGSAELFQAGSASIALYQRAISL